MCPVIFINLPLVEKFYKKLTIGPHFVYLDQRPKIAEDEAKAARRGDSNAKQ